MVDPRFKKRYPYEWEIEAARKRSINSFWVGFLCGMSVMLIMVVIAFGRSPYL